MSCCRSSSCTRLRRYPITKKNLAKLGSETKVEGYQMEQRWLIVNQKEDQKSSVGKSTMQYT